ncbi:MAG: hypothetical protein IPK07_22435 [Deltaproteobacteria bacterium]|nr:hypothetical protein [Deltaproteobacteria bacterium]
MSASTAASRTSATTSDAGRARHGDTARPGAEANANSDTHHTTGASGAAMSRSPRTRSAT